MEIFFSLHVLKRFLCISSQNKSKCILLEMALCELNFLGLQFFITVLSLVKKFRFGGKRIANTFKPTFCHLQFHRIKVMGNTSRIHYSYSDFVVFNYCQVSF